MSITVTVDVSSVGNEIDDKKTEYEKLVDELGEPFEIFADNYNGEDTTHENFDDAYCGSYDSEVSYARELINDCYNLRGILGELSAYFDYESFARDLFTSDYWSERDSSGSLHIYSNI